VLEQDWPVFSRGRFAQDSAVRTQVVEYRCPIEIGGVHVEPGDLVFGDLDGVVVVPKKVEKEVIDKALGKARGEKTVRKAIEGGRRASGILRSLRRISAVRAAPPCAPPPSVVFSTRGDHLDTWDSARRLI
jgi:regulator of RNase E activity RraA